MHVRARNKKNITNENKNIVDLEDADTTLLLWVYHYPAYLLVLWDAIANGYCSEALAPVVVRLWCRRLL